MALLTTATSGVGDHDELILVRVGDAGEEHGWETTLTRRVEADSVLKTSEYTGLTPEAVSRDGVSDEALSEALRALLQDKLVLTYNVMFQSRFLEPYATASMYSLPLWLKAAETRLPIDAVDTRDPDRLNAWAARMYGKDPSFRSVTRQLMIEPWSGVGLYVDWTMQSMRRMWSRLDEIPALVQGNLF